jgi:hypothetical protein
MTDAPASRPPLPRTDPAAGEARPASRPLAPAELRRRVHAAWIVRQLPRVIVAVVFLGSRAFFYLHCKLRYQELGVDFACQTLDLELLKHDLLRSVFYLNHQVPFFNLLIGIVYKLFPHEHTQAFTVIQVALGLGMALSLLSILETLGVGAVTRTAATLVFALWPTVVVYEWLLSYHHYGSTCLVIALAALGRLLRSGAWRWAHAFFFLLVAVAFFRSPFGLPWMALIVAALLFFRSVPRRLVLASAALPLLLLFLNTIKTPLQTGRSFGYALLAPNIIEKILGGTSDATKQELFRNGTLSPLSHLWPFFDLNQHPEYRLPLKPRGIPALDNEHKANGYTNANALQYVYITDGYMKDARWLLLHEPVTYARSVWFALKGEYTRDATDLVYIGDCIPAVAMKPWQAVADKLLLKRGDRLWGLTLGLPICFLYALAGLVGPAARMASSRSTTAILAVSVICILFATSMTLVSCGDFGRYRFDVDALYFVLFVLLLRDVGFALRRVATRLFRRVAPSLRMRAAEPATQ